VRGGVLQRGIDAGNDGGRWNRRHNSRGGGRKIVMPITCDVERLTRAARS